MSDADAVQGGPVGREKLGYVGAAEEDVGAEGCGGGGGGEGVGGVAEVVDVGDGEKGWGGERWAGHC